MPCAQAAVWSLAASGATEMNSERKDQAVPPDELRLCIVIPFYNHPDTIAQMLGELKSLALTCYLVNDGSDAGCEPALKELSHREANWVRLISYKPNQGKGMAVMTGMQVALRDGFTHAVQIDADGQHRVADVQSLLSAAQQNSRAVITGYPLYDRSVPRGRLYGRYATHLWVWINTLSFQIRDSMCGLRIYPLAVTVDTYRNAGRAIVASIGKRMTFDIEILVHLYWRGLLIVNVPVSVIYPSDGVSHFKLWRDNVQISVAHARMFMGMLWRSPVLLMRNIIRWSDRAGI